jgi:hypothetical protein
LRRIRAGLDAQGHARGTSAGTSCTDGESLAKNPGRAASADHARGCRKLELRISRLRSATNPGREGHAR